jgi:hypothetical protein
MFIICLDTCAFWCSVCVTKFANPDGPSFWINAFQVAERAIQPIQIDMVEVSAVVRGKLWIKREHNQSCSRDLKFLVYLDDVVAAFGIFGVAYNTPPTSRGMFAVDHARLVHPKVNTSKSDKHCES